MVSNESDLLRGSDEDALTRGPLYAGTSARQACSATGGPRLWVERMPQANCASESALRQLLQLYTRPTERVTGAALPYTEDKYYPPPQAWLASGRDSGLPPTPQGALSRFGMYTSAPATWACKVEKGKTTILPKWGDHRAGKGGPRRRARSFPRGLELRPLPCSAAIPSYAQWRCRPETAEDRRPSANLPPAVCSPGVP